MTGLADRFASVIEMADRALGRAVSTLTLAMVVVGAWNALARWSGRATGLQLASNALLELQWMLFSAVFLLAASSTLGAEGHVRVDVLSSRLSPAVRRTVDLAGHLLFLIPFCAAGLVLSVPMVRASWAVWEGSPDPGGLPRWPVKSLIPLCFGLVLVQGLARIVRDLQALARARKER